MTKKQRNKIYRKMLEVYMTEEVFYRYAYRLRTKGLCTVSAYIMGYFCWETRLQDLPELGCLRGKDKDELYFWPHDNQDKAHTIRVWALLWAIEQTK